MIHLRKLLAGLGLGTLAALIVLGLAASTDLADRLELTTYDWRMRLAADPASVSKDIVLVELNDASLREMSGLFGRWPWPRVATAYVLDFLKRAPAKVIAVDIQFTELDKVAQYDFAGDLWTGRQSDNALVEIREGGRKRRPARRCRLRRAGRRSKDKNAAAWPTSGYPPVAGVQRPLVLAPFQALTDASAALGHNFLTTDDDGPARRMSPFIVSDGKVMPSLGVAAALRAGGIRAGRSVRRRAASCAFATAACRSLQGPGRRHGSLDDADQLSRARAGQAPRRRARAAPYASYDFRHLFASEQEILTGKTPTRRSGGLQGQDRLHRAHRVRVAGRVPDADLERRERVDAGDPAARQHDRQHPREPVHPAGVRRARASGRVIITALAIGTAGGIPAVLTWPPAPRWRSSAAGRWFAVTAFKSGLWLNLVQPLAVGGLALFFGTAYQYFVEGKEKRKVAKLFGRYVSRDVYSQLMANPDQAELGGKRREMTVLFSDIRGFTSVTERGDPEELVEPVERVLLADGRDRVPATRERSISSSATW